MIHRLVLATALVSLVSSSVMAADDRVTAGADDRVSSADTRTVAPAADSAPPLVPIAPGVEGTSGFKVGAVPVASRGAVLPVLYVSFAALQVTDGLTTQAGLRRGAGEGNPLTSPVASSPAAFWAIKAGITTGAIVLSERLWRTHRRTEAIATMIIANGVMSAVAIHNAAVLGSLR